MSKSSTLFLRATAYCTLACAFTANVFAVEPLPVKDSDAKTESNMQTYDELIEHTEVSIRMLPIPGGKFVMGSPAAEADRKDDETQHEVKVDPFWMAETCLLYTSPSPRDATLSRMPSSA